MAKFRSLVRGTSPRLLLTAGPTRSYLDDVRYLSNHSTGQVGFEIAKEFIKKKWKVSMVAGPTSQPWEELELEHLVQVETAEQMLEETLKRCSRDRPHYFVSSAAILDFVAQKVRKGKTASDKKWTLDLIPSPKVIDAVGKNYPMIRRVGFKLESNSKDPLKLSSLYIQKKGLEGLCFNRLENMREGKQEYLFFSKHDLMCPIRCHQKTKLAQILQKEFTQQLVGS